MKKLMILFILAIFIFGCDSPFSPPVEEPEVVAPEPDPAPIVYESVFSVSGYSRGATTPVSIEWPVLTHDGTAYDLMSMTPGVNGLPVRTTYTETQRVIRVDIECDNYAFFYFMNDNMRTVEGIDSQDMTPEEFSEMLTFIYAPPEPEIPEYSETVYNLSGYRTYVIEDMDDLIIRGDELLINGVYYLDEDFPLVYIDGLRVVQIGIYVDYKDHFLFQNDNAAGFFTGLDITRMSREDLEWMADVLHRYPEESIWVLQGEWDAMD